ncbi:MAG: YdcF family protein [Limosilactobacillus sp.]|uniref:YdcF family protein n=1 Tax=Limosilactobacillus sp. TaxID=2773925 RepID=UPI00270BA17D|nr:YdcF family protein [Limosilactobacillus sp.]
MLAWHAMILTAAIWALTIWLVLYRQIKCKGSAIWFNLFCLLLMVSNICFALPVLFYVSKTTMWTVTAHLWLFATVTDIISTAGLIVFMLIMIAFRIFQPKITPDYILVLGAALHDGQVTPILAYRLNHAMKIWRRHQTSQIIVSGGMVRGDQITEAAAMKDYLVAHGVPEGQIIEEGQAKNTWENIRNTIAIVADKWDGDDAPEIVIVTSSFHILRARNYAYRLGANFHFASAPTPFHHLPLATVRDYLGVIRDHLYMSVLLLIIWVVIAEIVFY